MSDIPKTEKKLIKQNNLKGKAGPGRPRGLKNRVKLSTVHDTLIESNFNPIQELIKLLPELTPNGKVTAIELIMKYAYTMPKDEDSGNQTIQISYSKTPETV